MINQYQKVDNRNQNVKGDEKIWLSSESKIERKENTNVFLFISHHNLPLKNKDTSLFIIDYDYLIILKSNLIADKI